MIILAFLALSILAILASNEGLAGHKEGRRSKSGEQLEGEHFGGKQIQSLKEWRSREGEIGVS
jgi:hypothetical protein